MRLAIPTVLVLATSFFVAEPPAAADEAASALGADLLVDLRDVEGKLVGLAEVIPGDQYAWRPAEGVRSVSEALMHVASGNYFFPTLMGIEIPDGVNVQGLESITDPDQVVATLKKSFDHLATMIAGPDDAKLSETFEMFGRETTLAGALHAAVSHCHEHLGQLIAYARSIGVPPPWSQ